MAVACLTLFSALCREASAQIQVISVPAGGAGEGSYATLQAAEDALPADFVAAAKSYIIQVNTTGTYAGFNIDGHTMNGTYNLTVRPATGVSATIDPANNDDAVNIGDSYVTVEGLRITGVTQSGAALYWAGVYIYGGSNWIIRNCVFFGISSTELVSAIHCAGPTGSADSGLIQNCTIYVDIFNSYGILLRNTTNGHTIRNTIIRTYASGGNWPAIYIQDTGDLVACDYNCWSSTASQSFNIAGTYKDFATWRSDLSAISADVNSITSDPQFVSTAGNDFHLLSKYGYVANNGTWAVGTVNSPCIDAGAPDTTSPYDWAAEIEDNGDRIDMGTYGGTAQASKTGSEVTPTYGTNTKLASNFWIGYVSGVWNNHGNWAHGVPIGTSGDIGAAVIDAADSGNTLFPDPVNGTATLDTNAAAYSLSLTTGTLSIADTASDWRIDVGAGGFSMGGGTLSMAGVDDNADTIPEMITCAGNWSQTGGTAFQPTGGRVRFNGSSVTQTVNSSVASSRFWEFEVSGTSNTVRPLFALVLKPSTQTAASTGLIVTSGTLDVNGLTHDVNASVNLAGGTILMDASGDAMAVVGDWSESSGTFQATGGTVTFDAAPSGATIYSITTLGTNRFYHLTFSGGSSATFALASNVSVGTSGGGDLTLNSGKLDLDNDATARTHTIARDILINGGTFQIDQATSINAGRDVTIGGAATYGGTNGSAQVSCGRYFTESSSGGWIQYAVLLMNGTSGGVPATIRTGSSSRIRRVDINKSDTTASDGLVSADGTMRTSFIDVQRGRLLVDAGDSINVSSVSNAPWGATTGNRVRMTGAGATADRTVELTGGTLTCAQVQYTTATSVLGTFSMTGGTLDITEAGASASEVGFTFGNSGPQIDFSVSGGTINIGAGNFEIGSNSKFDPTGGTVSFSGTGAQTINLKSTGGNADWLWHLSRSGSGTLSFDDSVGSTVTVLQIRGNVSISAGTLTCDRTTNSDVALDVGETSNGNVTMTGGTFNPADASHTIRGNWDDSGGTFRPATGTGTITLDGPGTPASVYVRTGGTNADLDNAAAGNHFNNLVISLSSASGSVELLDSQANSGHSALEVRGSLTVRKGVLKLQKMSGGAGAASEAMLVKGIIEVAGAASDDPTLELVALTDLGVDGDVAVATGGNPDGTLKLTSNGTSDPWLRLGGGVGALVVSSGGTFRTLGSTDNPNLTWRNSTRFEVTIGSGGTVNVEGLNFDGSDGNGLRVLAGATIVDLDAIRFRNGAGAGGTNAFLKLNISDTSVYNFSGCTFDDDQASAAARTMNYSVIRPTTGTTSVFEFSVSGGVLGGTTQGPLYEGDTATYAGAPPDGNSTPGQGQIRWIPAYSWLGGTPGATRDWSTAANWSDPGGGASVPPSDGSADVIINADRNTDGLYTNYPLIDEATAAAKNLHVVRDSSGTPLVHGKIEMASGGTLTITGDLKMESNTSLKIVPGSEIRIAGDWRTDAASTFDIGTGPTYGTLTFNGAGSQSVVITDTFPNLNVSNTGSSVVTVTANIATANDFIIQNDGGIDISNITFNIGGNFQADGTVQLTTANSTVVFSRSSGTQQITGTGGVSFQHVEVGTGSSTNTVDTARNVDINGNLTVKTGATFALSGDTLNLGGSLTNSGTFSATSNSTVIYDGATNQSVANVTYDNLTVSNTGSAVANIPGTGTTTTVQGGLTISTDGEFTLGNNNLIVGGNLTVNSGATWNAPAGGTVTLNGSGSQSLTNSAATDLGFNNLTISNSNTAGGVTVTGAIDVNAALLLSNSDGTADFDLDCGSGTLRIGGGFTRTGGFTPGTGTIVFDTSSQTIPGGAYNNLTSAVGTGNAATVGGALTLSGNMTISSGTVTAGANSITVAGNWNRTAGAFSTSSTVTFDGTSSSTTSSETYSTLVVNKTGGTNLTIGSGATVAAGTVNVNGGVLRLDESGTLQVSGAVNVNSTGTFRATGTSSTPTLTWSSSTRYSFTAFSGSTIDVGKLAMSYYGASGMDIRAGATIQTLNGVSFSSAEGSTANNTHVKLQRQVSDPSSYSFTGCTFDTSFTVGTGVIVWTLGTAFTVNMTGWTYTPLDPDVRDRTDDGSVINWGSSFTWVGKWKWRRTIALSSGALNDQIYVRLTGANASAVWGECDTASSTDNAQELRVVYYRPGSPSQTWTQAVDVVRFNSTVLELYFKMPVTWAAGDLCYLYNGCASPASPAQSTYSSSPVQISDGMDSLTGWTANGATVDSTTFQSGPSSFQLADSSSTSTVFPTRSVTFPSSGRLSVMYRIGSADGNDVEGSIRAMTGSNHSFAVQFGEDTANINSLIAMNNASWTGGLYSYTTGVWYDVVLDYYSDFTYDVLLFDSTGSLLMTPQTGLGFATDSLPDSIRISTYDLETPGQTPIITTYGDSLNVYALDRDQTITTIGTPTDVSGVAYNIWAEPIHWTPHGVPTTVSGIIINGSSTYGLTPRLPGATTIGSLNMGETGSGQPTLTLDYTLTVSGSVVLGSLGANLTGTSKTVNVGGDWTQGGTLSGAPNLVINGPNGSTQQVTGSGSGSWGQLTLNKASGGTVLLGRAVTTTGTTTLTSGTLDTGSFASATTHTLSPLSINGGSLSIGDSDVTVATNNNENISTTASGGTITMSAGTIDCKGNWNTSAGGTFSMTGGTVKMGRSTTTFTNTLTTGGGQAFYNLTIAPASANTVNLGSSISVSGNIVVSSGTLGIATYTVTLGSGKSLSVSSGATLSTSGTSPSSRAKVQSSSGSISMTVGGSLNARYLTISNLDSNGVQIQAGSTLTDLTGVKFTAGTAGGRYLDLNAASFTTAMNIDFAQFDAGPTNNVRAGSGHANVTFRYYAGALSGEDYETGDTYDLVDWTSGKGVVNTTTNATFATLTDAIIAATNGQTIEVRDGVIRDEAIDMSSSGLNKWVTLDGAILSPSSGIAVTGTGNTGQEILKNCIFIRKTSTSTPLVKNVGRIHFCTIVGPYSAGANALVAVDGTNNSNLWGTIVGNPTPTIIWTTGGNPIDKTGTGTLNVDYSDVQNSAYGGTNLSPVNPDFVAFDGGVDGTDYTMGSGMFDVHLKPTSRCIDFADAPTPSINTDFDRGSDFTDGDLGADNARRPVDAKPDAAYTYWENTNGFTYDIGADELGPYVIGAGNKCQGTPVWTNRAGAQPALSPAVTNPDSHSSPLPFFAFSRMFVAENLDPNASPPKVRLMAYSMNDNGGDGDAPGDGDLDYVGTPLNLTGTTTPNVKKVVAMTAETSGGVAKIYCVVDTTDPDPLAKAILCATYNPSTDTFAVQWGGPKTLGTTGTIGRPVIGQDTNRYLHFVRGGWLYRMNTSNGNAATGPGGDGAWDGNGRLNPTGAPYDGLLDTEGSLFASILNETVYVPATTRTGSATDGELLALTLAGATSGEAQCQNSNKNHFGATSMSSSLFITAADQYVWRLKDSTLLDDETWTWQANLGSGYKTTGWATVFRSSDRHVRVPAGNRIFRMLRESGALAADSDGSGDDWGPGRSVRGQVSTPLLVAGRLDKTVADTGSPPSPPARVGSKVAFGTDQGYCYILCYVRSTETFDTTKADPNDDYQMAMDDSPDAIKVYDGTPYPGFPYRIPGVKIVNMTLVRSSTLGRDVYVFVTDNGWMYGFVEPY